MTLLQDLFVVFVITAALVTVFVWAVGWRSPTRADAVPAAMVSFAMLFLALWAASLWIVPVSAPSTPASPWLWLGTIGILLVLLFGALAPPPRRRISADPQDQSAALGFGIFFWLLLLTLLALIVAGYLI